MADANQLDLSIFSAISIQLQANLDPHNGTVYYAGSVAAANFQTATTTNWQNGSAQQIKLLIPSAQNIVPPSAEAFWLCIYGTVTATGDYVLLFAANIAGADSGVPQGVPSLPVSFKAGTKLSFVCSDGLTRDLTVGAGPMAGQWVTQINQAGYNGVGQSAFSLYCSDGLFRDLTLQLQDGTWDLAINQNGHS